MSAAGPVLRDIHLPAAPPWWPPAPGWWLLGAVLLCALAWLGWRALQRARLARRRRRLLEAWRSLLAQHPAEHDGAALVAGLSELLRRAARQYAPAALALQGEDWLAFLDGEDAAQPFRAGAGRLLLEGPYQRRVDAGAARALAELVAARLPRFVQTRHA